MPSRQRVRKGVRSSASIQLARTNGDQASPTETIGIDGAPCETRRRAGVVSRVARRVPPTAWTRARRPWTRAPRIALHFDPVVAMRQRRARPRLEGLCEEAQAMRPVLN